MQILGIGLMALVTDSINAMFRHLQKRICNIVDQQGVMSINGHLNVYQSIKTQFHKMWNPKTAKAI